MTDCLRKLAELFNKIDVSDLSAAQLAEKLGMTVEEFLSKIGDEFGELKDMLSEPDLGKISEKFKGLIGQNILFKTLSEAGDIIEEAGSIIANAGDYLEDKISSAISSLSDITAADVISAPFKLAGSVLSEINDQINKNICNGNILENLAGILGDIDGAIASILGALSVSDLKKLLEGGLFGKNLTNLIKGSIIVDTLTKNLKDKEKNQRFIAPPTGLTVNNDLPTSITTTLSALSGIVVDESIKKPINTHYTTGGPWDFDLAKAKIIYKFSINQPFLIKSDDLEVMSDDNLQENISDRFKSIYSDIDFDTSKDIDIITPVRDVVELSEVGDFIFNIGITGDTSHTLSGEFFESEITMVYGVNRRVKVSNEDCEQFTTTKMVLINNASFSGLGNSLADSRTNAFLECRNNIVNDIVSNKQSLIDIFKENI